MDRQGTRTICNKITGRVSVLMNCFTCICVIWLCSLFINVFYIIALVSVCILHYRARKCMTVLTFEKTSPKRANEIPGQCSVALYWVYNWNTVYYNKCTDTNQPLFSMVFEIKIQSSQHNKSQVKRFAEVYIHTPTYSLI